MKQYFRIAAMALIVALIVGMIAPVFASSLDDMYDELERIRQERREMEKDRNATKGEIDRLGRKLESLNSMLGQARHKLDTLNRQVLKQLQQIEQQETAIALTEQEIAETEAYLEEQVDYLEQRTRAIYMNGTVSYLEVLFAATSFSDFLSRFNFLHTIVTSDADLVTEVRETRDWLQQEKRELEKEYELLVERREQLEEDRASARVEEQRVENLVAQQKEVHGALQKEYARQNQAIGGLEQEEDRLNNEIAAMLDQEKWRKGEPPSSFAWPLPGFGSRYISSYYGWRSLSGRPNFHGGIDIAPPHSYWPASPWYAGTPAYIVAAASGEVVTVRFDPRPPGGSGYGWYVVIAHGGGYATLYAHMHQRPSVEIGQTVVRGQRIGMVGSTGWSTGPHVHFEIRVNGKRTNPLNHKID